MWLSFLANRVALLEGATVTKYVIKGNIYWDLAEGLTLFIKKNSGSTVLHQ